MKHFFRRIGFTTGWLGAGALALLPTLIALDYGGVLCWTQYVAALVTLAVCTLAILSLLAQRGMLRQHWLLLPLVLWLGFASFQTLPVSVETLRLLSPGSAQAYTDWIGPFVSRQTSPISLSVHDSKHACAILAVVIATAWASATLFQDRRRVIFLLLAISLGASMHAVIGMWELRFPLREGIDRGFGTFVNRNNAALLLNFGVGASLGLLAWRLTALRNDQATTSRNVMTDLLAVLRERDGLVGALTATLCLGAILVGGSRGGLLTACISICMTFWICRRGSVNAPTIALAILVVSLITVFLLPIGLAPESLRRIEVSAVGESSFLGEGRISHWRDGWQAALAHFPAGSGLGTYAFAYLPYQEYSSTSWFHHADNLWLELITEQGLVGILLVVAIFSITIIAYRRLAHSADPIDRGLRVTVCYLLVAIAVSQLFDFGLIVLSNLLVVAVLLPVLVSRSVLVNHVGRGDGKPIRSVPRALALRGNANFVSLTMLAVAISSLSILGSALKRLERDAQIQSLTHRMVAFPENGQHFDLKRLDELTDELLVYLDSEEVPTLLHALSKVEYQKARLTEALAANPPTTTDFARLYAETGPRTKRLQWLNTSAAHANQSVHDQDSYGRSFRCAERLVAVRPLSRDARTQMLFLDFVPQDRLFTRAVLEQLARLYKSRPEVMINVGRYALDGGEVEIAQLAFATALIRQPANAPRVLAILDESDVEMRALDLIPSTANGTRTAAVYLLQNESKYRAILPGLLLRMDCDSFDTNASRASCEELAGDIEYFLGSHDNAFAKYQAAIDHAPSNRKLRLKLEKRLAERERPAEPEKAVNAAAEKVRNESKSQPDTDDR